MCYEFKDNWMNYILYGNDSSFWIIDVNFVKKNTIQNWWPVDGAELGMNNLWLTTINALVCGPMIKVGMIYEPRSWSYL